MESQVTVQETILEKEPGTGMMPPILPSIITVTADERQEITRTGKALKEKYGSYENPEYIGMLHLNAYRLLPERIAKLLMQMGCDFSARQYGAVILRGLVHVDQETLGPTPPNWRETEMDKLLEYGFISSLLHGAVPSKPVEYFAQRRGGGMLHSIIPENDKAYSQTSAGSMTELFVHTEDAFLFHAADFLSFFYLRNEERVPSLLYSIRSHGRPGPALQPLFEPIYTCPKDANYSCEEAIGEGVHTSILYGNPKAPFIRFDAAEQIYNEDAGQSPEAMEHLLTFWKEARMLIYDEFIPQAGDLVFVNNHLCAHGRNAFLAGFKNENGRMVPCERRWMLRMMSKGSLIQIQSVVHPENPYMVMEEHYGKVYQSAW